MISIIGFTIKTSLLMSSTFPTTSGRSLVTFATIIRYKLWPKRELAPLQLSFVVALFTATIDNHGSLSGLCWNSFETLWFFLLLSIQEGGWVLCWVWLLGFVNIGGFGWIFQRFSCVGLWIKFWSEKGVWLKGWYVKIWNGVVGRRWKWETRIG